MRIDPDGDAENQLRADALEFMDTVRRAEKDILRGRRGDDVASELDVSDLREVSTEEWRAHWRQAPADPAADNETDLTAEEQQPDVHDDEEAADPGRSKSA